MKSTTEIAAELPDYDPRAMPVATVHAFLAQLVEPLAQQQMVPLVHARNRVLAQDVACPFDVPPHDNAAMDGYAFDGRSLVPGASLRLVVQGTALAGQPQSPALPAGRCVRIMTGAVMPVGTDTVVPQEFARTESAGSISVPADLLRRGDNRRLSGEDLRRGEVALRQGTRLRPAACGLLASLGIHTVPVLRRLRVAYFSTGDEILSVDEPRRAGAVYDSNRYTVRALLEGLGCEVLDIAAVPDTPVELEGALVRAAANADAVITSGGVGAGDADHTRAILARLGDVVFWELAMRPGRPMAVGRIAGAAGPDGSILFGLPGNPVAVMVSFLVLVRPALLRMMGVSEEAPPLLRARSRAVLRKKPGRTEYQRGVVSAAADGTLEVCSTGNQGSGVLSSMAQANGLIVLHPAMSEVGAGDWVDVMMFDAAC